MRTGKLNGLTWGDVDVAESRIRIAKGKTATARRWAELPEALTDRVVAACPFEDRTAGRRVFPVLDDNTIRMRWNGPASARGYPTTSPTTSVGRWINLDLKRGVPPAEVAHNGGHTRQPITLGTYSHVITEQGDRWPVAFENVRTRCGHGAHPMTRVPVNQQRTRKCTAFAQLVTRASRSCANSVRPATGSYCPA
ncbi:MAG: hypothetical protein OXG37_01250 [Actinomycetia bacterium]|nr:hypothetical protein [Actinomycetes bacterium]